MQQLRGRRFFSVVDFPTASEDGLGRLLSTRNKKSREMKKTPFLFFGALISLSVPNFRNAFQVLLLLRGIDKCELTPKEKKERNVRKKKFSCNFHYTCIKRTTDNLCLSYDSKKVALSFCFGSLRFDWRQDKILSRPIVGEGKKSPSRRKKRLPIGWRFPVKIRFRFDEWTKKIVSIAKTERISFVLPHSVTRHVHENLVFK